jgi:tetratricopeptide (TPR) repeat protein
LFVEIGETGTMPSAEDQRKLQTAFSLHQSGQPDQAARLYNDLIKKDANNFYALHFLGLIEAGAGNVAQAKSLMARSLAIRPANIQFVENYATLLYQAGDYNSALRTCRDGRKLTNKSISLTYIHAVSLLKLRRLQESLLEFDKLLSLKPDYVVAHSERAYVLAELEQYEAALASVDKALDLDRRCVDAYLNKGNICGAMKRRDQALAAYDKALSIRPDVANAWLGRGNVLRELKRYDEALAAYDKTIGLAPDSARAWFGRGNVFRDRQRLDEALACDDKAIALDPLLAEAWVGRGNFFLANVRPDEALANYEKALALKPEFAEALDRKGRALLELGRLAEASDAIEKAIKLAPAKTSFYLNLALSRRMIPGEPHVRAMEELAAEMSSLAADEQIDLNFALGKALADGGDHEQSFRRLLDGNAMKRKQIAYDEAASLGLFERTRTTFTAELLREKAGHGEPSSVPVFIVGMPRSGTTLTEQILASHPKVFGAGEIDDFGRLAANLAGVYPEAASLMSGEQFRALGAAYLGRIAGAAPATERVTNKMPDNFVLAGLIHLALPNARIIHTRRDPVDTCLSCFTNLFAGSLGYVYNLAELGRYYRSYEKLMAHWRAVLPPSALLEVQYEEVVADLEGSARRIVAHCGLEWDARCLDFHKTARPVRTASATQVRQPLYASSVGRWRAYESFLEPLLAELGASVASFAPDPA